MFTEPAPYVRERLVRASGLRRVLITISYDGTAYVGWQRQLNGIAVQQRVEEALQKTVGEHTPITGGQPNRCRGARTGAMRAL